MEAHHKVATRMIDGNFDGNSAINIFKNFLNSNSYIVCLVVAAPPSP
jgi:hypothetical protein